MLAGSGAQSGRMSLGMNAGGWGPHVGASQVGVATVTL